MSDELRVLRFEGIRPDSLGNYLAGLGLLSVAAAKWPWIRGCWREGQFILLDAVLDIEDIRQYLLNEWKSAVYERWWEKEYEADRASAKKKKPVEAIASRRARESINKLRALDSTVVALDRPVNNPLFGNLAGKLGAKRDFAKVQLSCWQFVTAARGVPIDFEAIDIAKDLKSVLKNFDKREDKAQLTNNWLQHSLKGEGCQEIPPIGSAGTWFTFANKTFNSGQSWYREGQMSPWSFLLAMEGASLLIGGVARRLSANARSYAVFPFVTDVPSPQSENEVGLVKAEFWAPLWQHPASLLEVRALLERGLARIGQRAAKAPHEFAIAARSAGVDAGVSEFVRFVLRQTTSSQVYEAVPGERIKVGSARTGESELIEQIIPWLDRLPYEPRDSKQKGKFKGLRGPVENAIIRLAERPDDAERWQRLLLLLAEMQGRIDRNKDLRGHCRALDWLNTEWFERAWPSPPVEIQIGRAIASIGYNGEMPLLVNVFGVELSKNRTPLFSGERRPQRAIWHNGEVVRLLADVLERRLVDTDAASPLPLEARGFCSAATSSAFLLGTVDAEMIGRWVPALSLIRWTKDQVSSEQMRIGEFDYVPDETFLLQALFRPLFYPHQLQIGGKELFPDHLRPRAATARRLLNLIRQGELSESVQLAQSRYLAAGRSIVLPSFDLSVDYERVERIAASLLIPMKPSDVAAGLRRWLQPSKNKLRGE